MSDQIILDTSEFLFRLKQLHTSYFNTNNSPIAIVLGKRAETPPKSLNATFYISLLGYEFPETLLIIGKSKILVVSSTRKLEIFKTLNIQRINSELKNSTSENLIKENIEIEFVENQKNQNVNEIMQRIKESFKSLSPLEFKVFDRGELSSLSNVLVSNFCNNFRLVENKTLRTLLIPKSAEFIDDLKLLTKANIEIFEQLKVCTEQKFYKNYELDFEEILDSKQVSKILNSDELSFINKVTLNELNSNEYCKVLSYALKYKNIFMQFERSFIIHAEKLHDDYKYYYTLYNNFLTESSEAIIGLDELLLTEAFDKVTQHFNVELSFTGVTLKEISFNEHNYRDCIKILTEIKTDSKNIYASVKFTGKNQLNFVSTSSFLVCEVGVLTSLLVDDYFYDGPLKPQRRTKIANSKKIQSINEDRTIHQKQLMTMLVDNNIDYYRNNDNDLTTEQQPKIVKYNCYTTEKNVKRKNKLTVDLKNFCVNVPINVFSVPVHIFYLKSFSRTENGVKINLKESCLIKSIVYKTDTPEQYIEQLNALRKNFQQKKESFEISDKIEKVETKTVLDNLYSTNIKTDTRAAKKISNGNVAVYSTGIVYKAGDKSTVLEIPFSNVKNVFVSTNENYVVHFELKEFLLFNNKKTKNVQFSKELMTRISDTTKFADAKTEQRLEREDFKNKQSFKKEILEFAKKLESIIENSDSTHLSVNYCQSNYFSGIPGKSHTIVEIAEDSLVSIQDCPFLVINLKDIEIVNFERITSYVKYFDLVFINKNKTDYYTISSIDTKYVEYLREFLDSRNKVFIETEINIKWNVLLKSVRENPLEFYESGGWMELQPNKEEESEETEIESSVEESETVESEIETESESLSESVGFDDERDSEISDLVDSSDYDDDEGVSDSSD